MRKKSIKQKGIRLILAASFLLSTCTPYFLEYDNPVDPKAESYPGWTVVATVDDVIADFPEKGSTIIFCEFRASEVYSGGADLYGLQLASSTDGFDAPFYENLTFTSNVMNASAADLTEGTWCYRVRAHAVNGDWGVWSEVVPFTVSSGIDSSDISPADGAKIFDMTPLLDWPDVDGAASYEVEFADSETGLDGSDIRSVAESEYQIPDEDFFSTGITMYLRIRAKNNNAVISQWSSVVSFTIITGSIGDTGPAGGIIFYDKGSFSDGWRYLEAAPVSTEWGSKVWGGYGTSLGDTEITIGTGAANTTDIVVKFGEAEPYQGKSDYAAKLCADLVYGGFDDWFLPSIGELNEMYYFLYLNGLGGFHTNYYYWSSSEYSALNAWGRFFYPYGGCSNKDGGAMVRAVRAF